MSQFSQKYYKHYFVGRKKDLESTEFDFWVWSSRYKFFEIIVILLLLLILFCVCSQCSQDRGSSVSKQQLSMQTVSSVPLSPITLKSKMQSSKFEEKEQTLTLQEKLPKLVLPELSKLIPKKEVTLEEYMYYVNDTNKGFPSYVDNKTNRMIKEKRPNCKSVECPVSGISKADKQAYSQWLSEQSGVAYTLVETSKGFFISQK